MNNSEVKCLQKMLIEKGFKIDGINAGTETTLFGYNTLIALKNFKPVVGLRLTEYWTYHSCSFGKIGIGYNCVMKNI